MYYFLKNKSWNSISHVPGAEMQTYQKSPPHIPAGVGFWLKRESCEDGVHSGSTLQQEWCRAIWPCQAVVAGRAAIYSKEWR